jgi:uncharacterized DUF497 family protein
VTLRMSGHAQRRLAERGITLEEAQEAVDGREIAYPSEEYPDERVVILGRTSAGRRLKVVVSAADNDVVITVADRDR